MEGDLCVSVWGGAGGEVEGDLGGGGGGCRQRGWGVTGEGGMQAARRTSRGHVSSTYTVTHSSVEQAPLWFSVSMLMIVD